jgi:hypothetical protein
MTEPLFFRPQVMDKVAGYKMPTNPKLWQSEIIRYLKSQHPYLPLDTAEIDIRRMDTGKGAAVGSVILDNQVAIPVIISRPRPGADPELAPMDVFFHQGRYRHLDPETVNSAVHTPQIGAPEGSATSSAVGGNPYIGDLTGDATPLEYSGQASPFAGPFSGAKTASAEKSRYEKMSPEARAALSFGTMGVISSPLQMAGDAMEGKSLVPGVAKASKGQLAKALAKKSVRGAVIGSAAAYIGTKAMRRLGMDRTRLTPEAKKEVADVVRSEVKKQASMNPAAYTQGVDYVLANGLTAKLASVDPNDLAEVRRMFTSNPALIQGQGWNMALVDLVARKQPESTTVTRVRGPNIVQIFKNDVGEVYVKFTGAPASRVSSSELKDMLRDRYQEVERKLRNGKVFVESDGVNRVSWDVESASASAKPVSADGAYLINGRGGEKIRAFVAKQMISVSGQVVPKKLIVGDGGAYAMVDSAFGTRISGSSRIPSSAPKAGQTGVFVTYIHGTPMPTTPMTVKAVKSLASDAGEIRVLYTVVDNVTGDKITLVPVRGAQGFERMRVMNTGVDALAEGQVFYMPGDVEWVQLRGRLPVAEAIEDMAKLSSFSDQGLAHVTSDGGLWTIKIAAMPFSGLAGRAMGSVLGASTGRRALIGAGVGAAGGAAKHMASNDPNSSLLGNMAAGAGVGALGGVAAKPLIQSAGGMTGGVGRWTRGSIRQGATDIAAAGGTVNPALRGEMSGMLTAARNSQAAQAAQKTVTASYDALPAWEARELLLAMGMDGDGAQWALDEAHRRTGLDRGVKIAGLHAPQLQAYDMEIEDLTPAYDDRITHLLGQCRPSEELLKVAAVSGHPETLDAILSLEFITPQNLQYFVDSIDDLDETTSRLAAMLVAVRLGMPHVPEEPVRQALEGLTKIVNRLRILKSALDHRNEQAATTALP